MCSSYCFWLANPPSGCWRPLSGVPFWGVLGSCSFLFCRFVCAGGAGVSLLVLGVPASFRYPPFRLPTGAHRISGACYHNLAAYIGEATGGSRIGLDCLYGGRCMGVARWGWIGFVLQRWWFAWVWVRLVSFLSPFLTVCFGVYYVLSTLYSKFLQLLKSTCYDGYMVNNNNI